MASEELVTLEQVEDVLLHGGNIDVVSNDDLQADMVRRILESPDLATAFADFKSQSVDTILQELVEVQGVAWLKSAFKEGPAVYALLKVHIIDSGELVTVSMGGRSLMASFVWAQRNEAMPIRGSFYKEQSRSNPENSFLTFKLAPVEA